MFSVMLKKYGGEEGGNVDMQKVFGFIGFVTLVGFWWLGNDHVLLSYLLNWCKK